MKKISILPYLFILVVTTLIFFSIAYSQGFNFNVPLYYDGDAIEVFAYTKLVLQNDIEHQFQKNAKIFQLPFVVNHWEWPKELSYYTESLKPYLHSKNLQWTYGVGLLNTSVFSSRQKG
jgi:hypothetical protein